MTGAASDLHVLASMVFLERGVKFHYHNRAKCPRKQLRRGVADSDIQHLLLSMSENENGPAVKKVAWFSLSELGRERCAEPNGRLSFLI